MPDLLKLLDAMATALRSHGKLDWASVGPSIGVSFTGERSIGTSGAATAIRGGRLSDGGQAVDGVILQAPRPKISLLFADGGLNEPDFVHREFAPNQKIVKSRSGEGYAITFPIRDIACAILVDQPGERVSGLSVSDSELAASAP